MILGEPMDEAQRGCLAWIGFPDDFRLIRTVRFPYEGVYPGFGMPGFSEVYL